MAWKSLRPRCTQVLIFESSVCSQLNCCASICLFISFESVKVVEWVHAVFVHTQQALVEKIWVHASRNLHSNRRALTPTMMASLFPLLTSDISCGLTGWFYFPSRPQGGPTQEAGPGSVDPALPQVYAPPPSYPPQGQGPSASVGRLPPLDFSSAHASSEYPEHPQLRVYQGPQMDGAEALPSSNTVRTAWGRKSYHNRRCLP